MSFELIRKIAKQSGDGKYTFTAHVASDGHADSAAVEVPAAALQSYSSFQRHVLESTGSLFANDAYEGKRGAREWRDDIADMLDRAEVKS